MSSSPSNVLPIWNLGKTFTTADGQQHRKSKSAVISFAQDYSGDGQITVGIRAGGGRRPSGSLELFLSCLQDILWNIQTISFS